LASQAALAAVSQLAQDLGPLQLATKLTRKHLDSVASTETQNRLEPALNASRLSRHRPFTPLVFSLGGLMESGIKDALQLWQGVMSGGNFLT